MSGHSRKYKIMLTNEERNHLKVVLRSSKTCNTIKKRCQILLALDCNTNPDTTYRNCAYYLGMSFWTRSRCSSSVKSVNHFLCARVLSRRLMQNTSAMELAAFLPL